MSSSVALPKDSAKQRAQQTIVPSCGKLSLPLGFILGAAVCAPILSGLAAHAQATLTANQKAGLDLATANGRTLSIIGGVVDQATGAWTNQSSGPNRSVTGGGTGGSQFYQGELLFANADFNFSGSNTGTPVTYATGPNGSYSGSGGGSVPVTTTYTESEISTFTQDAHRVSNYARFLGGQSLATGYTPPFTFDACDSASSCFADNQNLNGNTIYATDDGTATGNPINVRVVNVLGDGSFGDLALRSENNAWFVFNVGLTNGNNSPNKGDAYGGSGSEMQLFNQFVGGSALPATPDTGVVDPATEQFASRILWNFYGNRAAVQSTSGTSPWYGTYLSTNGNQFRLTSSGNITGQLFRAGYNNQSGGSFAYESNSQGRINQVSFDSNPGPNPPVPSPLPITAAIFAYGWSRRLRSRIRTTSQLSLS